MSEPPQTLTMPGYLSRVADLEIEAALRRRGAVLLEGARGCGKTWTGRNHARSEARLDDAAVRLLAAADPESVLAGEVPRLLDEWQNAPDIWNPVRRECDDRAQPGQFILTGSATPADDLTRHTGTGRVGRVLMRTMSLYESGVSGGAISLRALFEGAELPYETARLIFGEEHRTIFHDQFWPRRGEMRAAERCWRCASVAGSVQPQISPVVGRRAFGPASSAGRPRLGSTPP